MLSFRDGQLMVAAGQVADLTDEEIAAHPEAIFTDVTPPTSSTQPVRLGRTRLTTNPITAVTVGTDTEVNVPGGWVMPITVPSGIGGVLIRAFVPVVVHSVVNGQVILRLYRDGSLVQVGTHQSGATAGTGIMPGKIELDDTDVTPGDHVYKVMVRSANAGNITLSCGVQFPADLQALALV
jgi:hypothetical protein